MGCQLRGIVQSGRLRPPIIGQHLAARPQRRHAAFVQSEERIPRKPQFAAGRQLVFLRVKRVNNGPFEAPRHYLLVLISVLTSPAPNNVHVSCNRLAARGART
jgi:hypothetical protein